MIALGAQRVRRVLADVLAEDGRGGTVPERLCRLCAASLAVTGVGLVVLTGDQPAVMAATDGVGVRMERIQFLLGEGPCLDVARHGRVVLEPDLARAGPVRWPMFTAEAGAVGVGAVFALPLQVGCIRLGVLDLYRGTAGPLTGDQLAEALAFADAAITILLYLQQRRAPGQALHPQLTDLIAPVPEIHQATGMISVQAAVGMTEALLLLRARAFGDGRPVAAIARDVVARRLRFDPGGEHNG